MPSRKRRVDKSIRKIKGATLASKPCSGHLSGHQREIYKKRLRSANVRNTTASHDAKSGHSIQCTQTTPKGVVDTENINKPHSFLRSTAVRNTYAQKHMSPVHSSVKFKKYTDLHRCVVTPKSHTFRDLRVNLKNMDVDLQNKASNKLVARITPPLTRRRGLNVPPDTCSVLADCKLKPATRMTVRKDSVDEYLSDAYTDCSKVDITPHINQSLFEKSRISNSHAPRSILTKQIISHSLRRNLRNGKSLEKPQSDHDDMFEEEPLLSQKNSNLASIGAKAVTVSSVSDSLSDWDTNDDTDNDTRKKYSVAEKYHISESPVCSYTSTKMSHSGNTNNSKDANASSKASLLDKSRFSKARVLLRRFDANIMENTRKTRSMTLPSADNFNSWNQNNSDSLETSRTGATGSFAKGTHPFITGTDRSKSRQKSKSKLPDAAKTEQKLRQKEQIPPQQNDGSLAVSRNAFSSTDQDQASSKSSRIVGEGHKRRTLRASQNKCSEMILKDWTLLFSGSENEPQLRLRGVLMGSKDRVLDKNHTTARIFTRLSEDAMITTEGTRYTIRGGISGWNHCIPATFKKCLKSGLPYRWKMMAREALKRTLKSIDAPNCRIAVAPFSVEPFGNCGVLQKSRAGRVLIPRLEYWTGERVSTHGSELIYQPGTRVTRFLAKTVLSSSSRNNSERSERSTEVLTSNKKQNGKKAVKNSGETTTRKKKQMTLRQRREAKAKLLQQCNSLQGSDPFASLPPVDTETLFPDNSGFDWMNCSMNLTNMKKGFAEDCDLSGSSIDSGRRTPINEIMGCFLPEDPGSATSNTSFQLTPIAKQTDVNKYIHNFLKSKGSKPRKKNQRASSTPAKSKPLFEDSYQDPKLAAVFDELLENKKGGAISDVFVSHCTQETDGDSTSISSYFSDSE